MVYHKNKKIIIKITKKYLHIGIEAIDDHHILSFHCEVYL